jgi:hypothetical protein
VNDWARDFDIVRVVFGRSALTKEKFTVGKEAEINEVKVNITGAQFS